MRQKLPQVRIDNDQILLRNNNSNRLRVLHDVPLDGAAMSISDLLKNTPDTPGKRRTLRKVQL